LAVCFGCPGPGIANLMPGVLEAFSGCTPMLVLGVRSSRHTYGMGAFQETDHLGMMAPITKWATTVEIPERINWTIRRAIQIATSGKPGPVYVELPGDVGMGEWDIPEYVRSVPAPRPAADPAAIAEAAKTLASARRPLMILGGGAYLSGAGDAVEELASRFGVAIQTTPAGRGTIAEGNRLFCGLTGLYRTTFPREVYEAADVILTVGSRMEEFQGGFLPRAEGAKIVQIDIDDFELGRNWRPDVAVQADATHALEALIEAMAGIGARPNAEWVERVQQGHDAAIAAARADAVADIPAEGPMQGKSIVSEINRVFGENTILVKENGGQDLWVYYWPYYQVLDRRCCVPPAEQTAMGYGIIGSLAAKLAEPGRQVVSTCGDGAFQMSIHELGTAAQEKLPVTWVVMNDNAFGWVQWIQRRGHDSRIVATQFDPPADLLAIVKASGCDGVKVERPEDLGAALEQAKAANAKGIPFMVEVPVLQAHHHAEFDRFHGYEPAPGSATI
ncbi:MAG: thiamine pyrophosphate-binding protein, partial [Thermomicrobiales bacterium]